MKPEILVLLVIFSAFATAEALRTGLFKKAGQRSKDVVVEVATNRPLMFTL